MSIATQGELVEEYELAAYAQQFREEVEPLWEIPMRSPFYEPFSPHSIGFDAVSRGYCAPTAYVFQQNLAAELGITSRLAFGRVKRLGTVAIRYHVWLHVPSSSYDAPLILDVTADQGFGPDMPVVVCDADTLEDEQQISYRAYGEGAYEQLRPDSHKRGMMLMSALLTKRNSQHRSLLLL